MSDNKLIRASILVEARISCKRFRIKMIIRCLSQDMPKGTYTKNRHPMYVNIVLLALFL